MMDLYFLFCQFCLSGLTMADLSLEVHYSLRPEVLVSLCGKIVRDPGAKMVQTSVI